MAPGDETFNQKNITIEGFNPDATFDPFAKKYADCNPAEKARYNDKWTSMLSNQPDVQVAFTASSPEEKDKILSQLSDPATADSYKMIATSKPMKDGTKLTSDGIVVMAMAGLKGDTTTIAAVTGNKATVPAQAADTSVTPAASGPHPWDNCPAIANDTTLNDTQKLDTYNNLATFADHMGGDARLSSDDLTSIQNGTFDKLNLTDDEKNNTALLSQLQNAAGYMNKGDNFNAVKDAYQVDGTSDVQSTDVRAFMNNTQSAAALKVSTSGFTALSGSDPAKNEKDRGNVLYLADHIGGNTELSEDDITLMATETDDSHASKFYDNANGSGGLTMTDAYATMKEAANYIHNTPGAFDKIAGGDGNISADDLRNWANNATKA